MKLEGLSFIGNRRAVATGKPIAPINPATGAALEPNYSWSTAAEVEAAAQLAWQAFAEYSRWPAVRRAAVLRRIAELMEANAAAIVERGTLETALPAGRLQGELART